MPAAKSWSISADWIVPVDKPFIRNGVLRGRGQVIEAVGPAHEVPHTENHRIIHGGAILPGLINAYTHLELTYLAGKLKPNRSFPEWYTQVLAARLDGKEQDAVVADGADQARRAGTTTMVDVSHNHRNWRALRDQPMRSICLAEVNEALGPVEEQLQRIVRNMRSARSAADRRFGLAPLSPYLVSADGYKAVLSLAGQRNWHVATRLSETDAERQFLLHGLGSLIEFCRKQGIRRPANLGCGLTPVAFAREVGLLDFPSLLVHVNRVDDEDIKLLSQGSASCIYCPHANKFHGRVTSPYAEMLSAGVNVALGSESLACNSTIDMVEEMRQVRMEGKVHVNAILEMATLNGARALGLDDKIGSLSPGKFADWVAVEVPAGAGHPIEGALTLGGKVIESSLAGEVVCQNA